MMVRSALAKMSWDGYTLRSLQHTNPAFVPTFLYGTAWKKDRTGDLVHQAINTGFRAVDTAAQPRHYREDLVGEGVRKALSDGIVRREDLYVCDAEDLSNWGTNRPLDSDKVHLC
jgi:diketogulonate reductase-like aldo/keto reductase